MKIICIPVGNLQANCYIVIDKQNAIIIDPGDDHEKIENYLKDYNVVGIFLTHNHFDHTGALSYFEKKYNLKHNDEIKEFDYEIINTPGHSKDSITIYFPKEKVMFSGDFLFKGTIGRMDLPGGNKEDMKKSLSLIETYPNNIEIYPGHGSSTVLEIEKKRFGSYL